MEHCGAAYRTRTGHLLLPKDTRRNVLRQADVLPDELMPHVNIYASRIMWLLSLCVSETSFPSCVIYVGLP